MRAIPVDWTRDMVVHEEVSDQPILPFGNGLQDIKVARNCLVLIPSKHTARWQMASDGGTIDKFPIGTDFAVEDSVQAVVCDSDAMVLEVVDLVLADYRGTEKFCDGRTLCTDSWDSGGSSSRSRSSGHHTERSFEEGRITKSGFHNRRCNPQSCPPYRRLHPCMPKLHVHRPSIPPGLFGGGG